MKRVIIAFIILLGSIILLIVSSIYYSRSKYQDCIGHFLGFISKINVHYLDMSHKTAIVIAPMDIYKLTNSKWVFKESYKLVTNLTNLNMLREYHTNNTAIIVYQNCENINRKNYYLHNFQKYIGGYWQVFIAYSILIICSDSLYILYLMFQYKIHNYFD